MKIQFRDNQGIRHGYDDTGCLTVFPTPQPPPTEPGWNYWRESKRHTWMPVHVDCFNDGKLWATLGYCNRPIEECGGQWGGPLPKVETGEPVPDPPPATCKWTRHPPDSWDTDAWDTGCGKITFCHVGPVQAHYAFCHYCGKRIEEVRKPRRRGRGRRHDTQRTATGKTPAGVGGGGC